MSTNPIYEEISNWQGLRLHSLCTLFPQADEHDYNNLVMSMKTHGFLESDPIILIEENPDDPDTELLVLDGRNRQIASVDADVSPKFALYTGDNPIGFVTSKNLDRRHLTTGQRAAVASELANLESGHNADEDSMTQSEAAEKVGVGEATVRRYKFVEKHDPELAAQVKSGEVPLEKARATIKKEIDEGKSPVTVEDALSDAIPPTLGDKKAARKAREKEELMDEINNIVDIEMLKIKSTDDIIRSAMITCVTRGYMLGKQSK